MLISYLAYVVADVVVRLEVCIYILQFFLLLHPSQVHYSRIYCFCMKVSQFALDLAIVCNMYIIMTNVFIILYVVIAFQRLM